MWGLDFFRIIDLEVFDICMQYMQRVYIYVQRSFNNSLNVFFF